MRSTVRVKKKRKPAGKLRVQKSYTPRDTVFNFRISAAEKRVLEDAAAKKDMTQSDLIREALNHYIGF